MIILHWLLLILICYYQFKLPDWWSDVVNTVLEYRILVEKLFVKCFIVVCCCCCFSSDVFTWFVCCCCCCF